MNYRGFEITIEQDPYPDNPFTSWDNNPDLIVYNDRYIAEYSDGREVKGPLWPDVPTLTREQIKDNLDDIKRLLGEENLPLLTLLKYSGYYDHHTDAVEAVNDMLSDEVSYSSGLEQLKTLAEILTFAGIPNYRTTSQGYSQSSWADLLVYATPEFLKRVGLDTFTEDQLKAVADLYGYWAWGDVYGWIVEDIDESCWGYYGDDHEKSGLIDTAKQTIDAHISYERKKFRNKLKQLIKHRVPLHHRPTLPKELSQ